ncbi:hypothetical protein QMK33_05005 [Hymenobacter sp. H14-R3]|uniref:hypothetical protein n=1 Tax=Hymenobacter sp. H14-R3 TaxID=3046308 RepID=UPI0024B96712|nr:hypothetical protein [Hymenobacter sp. H14-R3]MDJ0364501.1 hypothetical protein [Hymenobacter sp. H14-R3]
MSYLALLLGRVERSKHVIYFRRAERSALVNDLDDDPAGWAARLFAHHYAPVTLVLAGKADRAALNGQKRQRLGPIGDGVKLLPLNG